MSSTAKRAAIALAAVAALVSSLVWLVGRNDGVAPVKPGARAVVTQENPTPGGRNDDSDQRSAVDEDEQPVVEEPADAEDKPSPDSAEARVDAFDALTDRWMEPSGAEPTMDDVAAFLASFNALPAERKDECIHRALNLIPDEHVMLLAGVLMDRTQDREIVMTVFNDVLNRQESVKLPIMREIFKDRSHPCWADVAWIFDVTGETAKPPSR